MTFFLSQRNRLFTAFLIALACGGGYSALSVYSRTHFSQFKLYAPHDGALDLLIPFVPGWIWIYMLYYPACFLLLFLKDVRNDPLIFRQTAIGFGLQFFLSFTVFLLWPLRMIHPVPPVGTVGLVLNGLYQFDQGFCSFPSLHVANVVFVALLFHRLKGPRWGWAISLLALLITISTMLVKQHFVSDVIAGALLGAGSYWLAFRLILRSPTEEAVHEPGVC